MKVKSRKFILFDSSFLVALLSPNDVRYRQALTTFNIINEKAYRPAFIFPNITISEVLFVMQKKGYNLKKISSRIYNLINYLDSLSINVDILTMIDLLGDDYADLRGDNGITKTNDYIISSIAYTYDALLISADKKMCKVFNNTDLKAFNF